MSWWTLVFLACSASAPQASTTPDSPLATSALTEGMGIWPTGLLTMTACTGASLSGFADAVAVTATGGPQDWTVSVTVSSPDEDCDQYADWWEIVSPEGELLYRRILNHSHADEQPFTRSSEGLVTIAGDRVVRVRAHLHPGGFEGQVLEGTLEGSFLAIDVEPDFAADLGMTEPLPQECWF